MATLTGQRIKDSYKDLLQVSNSNSGIDSTLRAVSDGEATSSLLQLSTTAVNISSAGTLQYAGVAITSTAAELNILDGATVTVAELNVLDGYTGSVIELNYLDTLHATGVTATEFDYLDGVTSSIQVQLDATFDDVGTGLDTSGTTISLDLNELGTETSIADADFLVMVDATDDGSQKITFENLEDAIFSSVSGDITITEAGVAAIQANSVVLATDTTGNYVATVADSGDGGITVANSGSENAGVTLELDVHGLTTAILTSGDFIAFSDEDQSGDPSRKESIDDIATLFAGTGLTASSAVIGVDAAQTQITSLGTLTALQVDNLNINGNTISSTAGTDLLITPLSGQQIVLDGTIVVDAGVVTGATSVTSTAFVGDITGTASKATVTDSTANTNFPVVFHDEGTGNVLLDDTGALRYNPSTGELLVPKLTVAGTTTTVDTVTMEAANAIKFEGATADANETILSIVDPTNDDNTQYLLNASGYIPLLNAVSTTVITATPAELNYVDGVTSSIQTQLDATPDTGGTNLTLSGTTFNVDDAFLVNDADDTTSGTITAGGFTTASGNLIVGGTSRITNTVGTATAQVLGTGNSDSALTLGRFSANTGVAVLNFTKSRHATIGSNTILADGDGMGSILWSASDGNDMVSHAAKIDARIDGTPGANDTPGRLMFYTTADGAESAVERMRIDSSGNVGIGVTPSKKFHVKGASGDIARFEHNGAVGAVDIYSGTDGGLLNVRNASGTSIINIDARNDKLQLGDSIKLLLGADSDLRLYHDGSNGSIENHTGNLYIDNNTDNGEVIFRCDDNSGGLTSYFALVGSQMRTTFYENVRVADSKELTVGDGDDLAFSHNGTNSFVVNSTGDLTIQQNSNDGDIIFNTDNGSGGNTNYMVLDGGATAIDLMQDTRLKAAKKLFLDGGGNSYITETSADLVDLYVGGQNALRVLETSNVSYAYVPDNMYLGAGTGIDFTIRHDGSHSYLVNSTGNTYIRNQDGGYIYLQDVSGNSVITVDVGAKVVINDSSRDIDFIVESNGDANCLFVDGGANKVGVGTNAPAGKLMVREDAAGSPARIIVSNGGNAESGTAARLSFYEGTDEKNYIERRRDGSGHLAFVTPADDNPFVWENATGEFMRFTGSKVGIAMNNPAHILDVTGTAGLSTGTAWTNTSDERIKTNVENIENGLDKILKLKPVSFNYTEDYLKANPELSGSQRYNSFIAQEYEEVFPDAVTSEKELVVDGKVIYDDLKQFTPHDLNMYLVKAIQEMKCEIDELKLKLGE